MVRTPCFHCQGWSSPPCQGTKIPQAARHSQKEKKKFPQWSWCTLKFEHHSSGLGNKQRGPLWQNERDVTAEIIAQHFVDTSESKAPQVKWYPSGNIRGEAGAGGRDGAGRVGAWLRQGNCKSEAGEMQSYWLIPGEPGEAEDVPKTLVKGVLCSRHWARCWILKSWRVQEHQFYFEVVVNHSI